MLLAGPFIRVLLFQHSCFRTVTSVPLFQHSCSGTVASVPLLRGCYFSTTSLAAGALPEAYLTK
jgi:hypothetical protein